MIDLKTSVESVTYKQTGWGQQWLARPAGDYRMDRQASDYTEWTDKLGRIVMIRQKEARDNNDTSQTIWTQL